MFHTRIYRSPFSLPLPLQELDEMLKDSCDQPKMLVYLCVYLFAGLCTLQSMSGLFLTVALRPLSLDFLSTAKLRLGMTGLGPTHPSPLFIALEGTGFSVN